MIPELGHFALVLALVLAVVQGLVPLAGAARRDEIWMGMAPRVAVGQFAFVALAFGALAYAFLVNDFSVSPTTLTPDSRPFTASRPSGGPTRALCCSGPCSSRVGRPRWASSGGNSPATCWHG